MSQTDMRVLVVWGSKLGGTQGIAELIGDELRRTGFDTVVERASRVPDLKPYDAVIVGGALYANRWHNEARRFVQRNVEALRRRPVWFFSSGPLDDSADQRHIAPTVQVGVLMERVGAIGHVTFGGRLPADTKGFPAAEMAKTKSGDWRSTPHIRGWANELSRELPTARPGVAVDHPAYSLPRLIAHGALGWGTLTAVMFALLRVSSKGVALTLVSLLTPMIFTMLSVHYFRQRGAREPVFTALVWTIVAAVLDLAIFRIGAMWIPFVLVFVTTWAVGFLRSTMPWGRPDDLQPRPLQSSDPSGAGSGTSRAP